MSRNIFVPLVAVLSTKQAIFGMTGELAAHKEEKTLELVGKNENYAQIQLHELLETKVSREKNQCHKQSDFGMVCKLCCGK